MENVVIVLVDVVQYENVLFVYRGLKGLWLESSIYRLNYLLIIEI